ncbi:MAG: tagatose 1,6-diphosphate aldolase [Dehalococcoidales bacterium]|nr:tagatose 1,6-diphosphate aldolase [Dehalococcoidales bacterium]
MKKLTIGKLRGLQQLANNDGVFNICAMDHRRSLSRIMEGEKVIEGGTSYEEMAQRKLELCTHLAPHASAVLLDPLFGAAQCISHGALPRSTGLLVSLEASGYAGASEYRMTELEEGWSVEKIKRMGASAVKFLIYYRPDLIELANKLMELVEAVGQECQKYDIPLVIEPLSYPLGGETKNPAQFAAAKEQLVLKTAQHITALPVDLLKSEFPGDLRYNTDKAKLIDICQKLDKASQVPWVVLSAGVSFDVFCQQVEIACRGGASGFLAGRAIWQEAMNIDDPKERAKMLKTLGVERLNKLTEIAAKHAVPWYQKLGLARDELAQTAEGWYQQY